MRRPLPAPARVRRGPRERSPTTRPPRSVSSRRAAVGHGGGAGHEQGLRVPVCRAAGREAAREGRPPAPRVPSRTRVTRPFPHARTRPAGARAPPSPARNAATLRIASASAARRSIRRGTAPPAARRGTPAEEADVVEGRVCRRLVRRSPRGAGRRPRRRVAVADVVLHAPGPAPSPRRDPLRTARGDAAPRGPASARRPRAGRPERAGARGGAERLRRRGREAARFPCRSRAPN